MTRIIAGAAGGQRLATPPGGGTRPTSDRVREALFSRLEHLDALRGARVLDLYAGSGALGLEALSRGAAGVVLVESVRPVAQVARRNARQVAAAVPDVGPDAVLVRAEPVLRYLRAAAGAGGGGGGHGGHGGPGGRGGPVGHGRPVGPGGHDGPGGQYGQGGHDGQTGHGSQDGRDGHGGHGGHGAFADLVFIDPPYDLAETQLAQVLAELACRHLRPGAIVVVERSTRSPEPRWPAASVGVGADAGFDPDDGAEHDLEHAADHGLQHDAEHGTDHGADRCLEHGLAHGTDSATAGTDSGTEGTGTATEGTGSAGAEPGPQPARLRPLTDRAYGDTRLWFAEFS